MSACDVCVVTPFEHRIFDTRSDYWSTRFEVLEYLGT